jgi:hypothetical protein
MKTIEVTEETYAKLVELATEMTTQDPRCTRMPHMFQIRDWKRQYDWNLNGDTKCWIDRDGDFTVIETLEDFKSYLENTDIEEPENLDELWEDQYDLQDWIEDHCDDLQECSYSMEAVYSNCFLTAKAAQEHLDRNDYHYHKNADVYLNHAWRNPEAELVSEFLCGLVGKKLHT